MDKSQMPSYDYVNKNYSESEPSTTSKQNSLANTTALNDSHSLHWPFLSLFLIPILTVWGNVLVCLSVYVEKRLRSSFNYFLVSLATSDMLCALLVMPVSAWKMVRGDNFPEVPKTICLAWYSLDVFFTASTIIHLCTISIDRYFALRNPLRYHRSRKKSSLMFKIAIAWIIPFSIAGPLFLLVFYLENKQTDPSFKGCGPNNVYFLLTATAVTFFLPLILMAITYVLTVMTVIDQTNKAKDALFPKGLSQLVVRPNASALGLKKIENLQENHGEVNKSSKPHHALNNVQIKTSTTSEIEDVGNEQSHLLFAASALSTDNNESNHNNKFMISSSLKSSTVVEYKRDSNNIALRNNEAISLSIDNSRAVSLTASTNRSPNRLCVRQIHASFQNMKLTTSRASSCTSIPRSANPKRAAAKQRMDYVRKGRKAVQVLGILFVLFVLCYLPFFLCYLTDFFCISCQPIAEALLMPLEWVAYSASMLNPIVYHIFNPIFRRTFHQLMCSRCASTFDVR